MTGYDKRKEHYFRAIGKAIHLYGRHFLLLVSGDGGMRKSLS